MNSARVRILIIFLNVASQDSLRIQPRFPDFKSAEADHTAEGLLHSPLYQKYQEPRMIHYPPKWATSLRVPRLHARPDCRALLRPPTTTRLAVTLVRISSGCPRESENAKAVNKSGEILDQSMPITIDNIKRKLKESGVFDWQDPTLNDREKKEMTKLFDAVEIMTTSRARQPAAVQNIFASLRLVERVVKKQLKEGQISESLAAKFHWDKITVKRLRREKPLYHLDQKTNMRVFNTAN